MKPAPLTLDTLQSKTAEFDSVFFFPDQQIVSIVIVCFFYIKINLQTWSLTASLKDIWLRLRTTVLLFDWSI